MRSVLFVHGTGVRERGFVETLGKIESSLPGWRVFPCYWGGTHGVELHHKGASIPDYEAEIDWAAEGQVESLWELLYQDPLHELRQAALAPIEEEDLPPNQLWPWEELRARIEGYAPSEIFDALLVDAQLREVWPKAFTLVLETPTFEEAGRTYSANNEEVITRIARAMIAAAIRLGMEESLPLPDGDARDALVKRLAVDFGQRSYRGILETAVAYYLRPLTFFAERARSVVSDGAFPGAGDILLYQRRGEGIRAFIEDAIRQASRESDGQDIVVLAHSLGGIACFDLLAKTPDLPVKALITAGSQAPLLYELDCLFSLRFDEPLRADFPRWLNVYDRQDLLSYIGGNLFPKQVEDFEVKSRQPFPVSHSAYWGSAELWKKVVAFAG